MHVWPRNLPPTSVIRLGLAQVSVVIQDLVHDE